MRIPTKRIILGVISVAAIGAGIYAWQAIRTPNELPERFASARNDAADASEEVVRLTGEVRSLVGGISAAERTGEHDTAVSLTREAMDKNEAARQAALTLTNRLQALAESLGDIASDRSQRLAFEAVTAQLAVAAEYGTYASRLTSFLDAISAPSTQAGRTQSIEEALAAVNQSAARINELNSAALAARAALDASL